jgi:phage terminase large subunit-like protein
MELQPTTRLHHLLRLLTRDELTTLLSSLPDSAVLAFLYDWEGIHARDSQLLPAGDDWNTWLILAGRGFGKTRTGAETTRAAVERGIATRIALVAPTAADARDTMVEGESGLLAVCPPWFKAHYEPSKRRVTWKRNGREVARATLFSAEEPERFRGPQHDWVWGDEPASWPDAMEAWAQLQLGLRLGRKPRAIITGTPKPVELITMLVRDKGTVVTRGATYENSANLAANYIETIGRLYGSSRLGKQEIYGEILEAAAGIFDMAKVEAARRARAPELRRIVVAIDPAQNSERGVDETGIVVVGLDEADHGYVLEDATLKGTPDEWANRAAQMFYKWQADCVVAEVNVGGEMVEFTLRTVDPSLPVKTVRAMRGKAKRAEPIAALFEQGKVHLVGDLPKLEAQMRAFTGINGRRDDRTDAMCWGLHELMLGAAFAFV